MPKIENIFSKSSSKKETNSNFTKTQIIVDSREKQSLVLTFLRNKNANAKIEKLDIADYLVGNIVIERKTFSDFTSSMINKRLQTQLQEIKKYEKYFLIVEGFYYNYQESKIHENATRGMFLSTILDFKVPIIFTQDEEETAKFLILLAKKSDKPKTELSVRPTKNIKSFEEQKQFILEGFPGIGPTLAKKILKEFKTLQNLFSASKEELKLIENFREDKIETFKSLLEK